MCRWIAIKSAGPEAAGLKGCLRLFVSNELPGQVSAATHRSASNEVNCGPMNRKLWDSLTLNPPKLWGLLPSLRLASSEGRGVSYLSKHQCRVKHSRLQISSLLSSMTSANCWPTLSLSFPSYTVGPSYHFMGGLRGLEEGEGEGHRPHTSAAPPFLTLSSVSSVKSGNFLQQTNHLFTPKHHFLKLWK